MIHEQERMRRRSMPRMVTAVAVLSVALTGAQALSATAQGVHPRGECDPDAGYTNCRLFTDDGREESWVVPAGVSSVHVLAWGGGGGGVLAAPDHVGSRGGGGGFASGDLPVSAGDTVHIQVGAGGQGYDLGTPKRAGYGGGASRALAGSEKVIAGGGGGGGGGDAGHDGIAGGDSSSSEVMDGKSGADGRGGAGGVGGGGRGHDGTAERGGDGAATIGIVGQGGSGGGGAGGYGGGGGGGATSLGSGGGGGGGGGNLAAAHGTTQAGGGAHPGEEANRFRTGDVGYGGGGGRDPLREIDGHRGLVVIEWGEDSGPVVDHLVVVSGDHQSVSAGGTFAPLSVRAVTSGGEAVTAQDVSFVVFDTSGTGTAFDGGDPQLVVATGPDGVATTSRGLVAGSHGGPVLVSASAAGKSIVFSLTINAATADHVAVKGGDNQSAVAGSAFAMPLSARVESPTGTGIGNVPVTFTISGNTGSRFNTTKLPPGATARSDGTQYTITSANDPADPSVTGTATTPPLIAGPQSGTFTVSVEADGIEKPVLFSETVTSGAATTLRISSGDGQTAVHGTVFAHNLQVLAVNSAGRPVQNAEVTFRIQGATGSTFYPSGTGVVAYTDENGLAGTLPIVAGDAGSVTVLATTADGASVSFHLTVTA